MGIDVTTAPSEEPVSLAEARLHLGIHSSLTADDSMITTLIKVARQSVENYLNRAICTQTITLKIDNFPAFINLPRLPVQSITSITYIDEDGVASAFTDYLANLSGVYSNIIEPAYGYSWPSTRYVSGAVTVVYVAGWGNPSDSPDPIPMPIKQAILLMLGSMYANRENEVVGVSVSELPINIRWLLNPYRLSQI
jgi:uncharacterized phiE125 gp8 family phage protein